MTHPFTETHVENAALTWLQDVGYHNLHGPAIAPGQPAAARDDYSQVILPDHLRAALLLLNLTWGVRPARWPYRHFWAVCFSVWRVATEHNSGRIGEAGGVKRRACRWGR